MPTRRRFATAIAVGSAAALVGALSTGFTVVGMASSGDGSRGVTASSQRAVSPLVAHYTVSPAERPEATSSNSAGSDSRQLPRLNKFGKNSVAHNSAGPLSDNTNAVSQASGSLKAANQSSQSGAARAK